MEPLLELRECYANKALQKLRPEDTHIKLLEQSPPWPLDTRTAWKEYSLHSLVLLLELADEPFTTYFRTATSLGVKFVSTKDKKEVLQYLRGEISTSGVLKEHLEKAFKADGDGYANKRMRIDPSRLDADEKSKGTAKKHRNSLRRSTVIIIDPASSEKMDGFAMLEEESVNEMNGSKAKRQKQKRNQSYAEEADNGEDDPQRLDPNLLDATKEMCEKADFCIYNEHSRNSVLRMPNSNYEFGLKYFNELIKRSNKKGSKSRNLLPPPPPNMARIPPPPPPNPPSQNMSLSQIRKVNESDKNSFQGKSYSSGNQPSSSTFFKGPPIIIVPKLKSCLLTLKNAQRFFESDKFEEGDDEKVTVSPEIKVSKKMKGGSVVEFRIIDNPKRLHKKEWHNVVCVIVQGQAWQFKGWLWEKPVELFANVLGLHFMFQGDPLQESIRSWNVKVIKMDKYSRHGDAAAAFEMWRLIYDFMKVRKSELFHSVVAMS